MSSAAASSDGAVCSRANSSGTAAASEMSSACPAYTPPSSGSTSRSVTARPMRSATNRPIGTSPSSAGGAWRASSSARAAPAGPSTSEAAATSTGTPITVGGKARIRSPIHNPADVVTGCVSSSASPTARISSTASGRRASTDSAPRSTRTPPTSPPASFPPTRGDPSSTVSRTPPPRRPCPTSVRPADPSPPRTSNPSPPRPSDPSPPRPSNPSPRPSGPAPPPPYDRAPPRLARSLVSNAYAAANPLTPPPTTTTCAASRSPIPLVTHTVHSSHLVVLRKARPQVLARLPPCRAHPTLQSLLQILFRLGGLHGGQAGRGGLVWFGLKAGRLLGRAGAVEPDQVGSGCCEVEFAGGGGEAAAAEGAQSGAVFEVSDDGFDDRGAPLVGLAAGGCSEPVSHLLDRGVGVGPPSAGCCWASR